jgi:hypothetical protein
MVTDIPLRRLPGAAAARGPACSLVNDRDVRVISDQDELLTIDPTKDYQPRGRP